MAVEVIPSLPRDAERRAERHVMVDLETLGARAGAVIFTLGAVPFDLYSGTLGTPFFALVDPEDAQKEGLRVDPQTLKFWNEEVSPDARAYLEASYVHGLPLKQVLTRFSHFIEGQVGSRDQVRLWGKGADFDKPILQTAYACVGLPEPWGMRAARCYRSLEAFMSEKPVLRTQTGIAHHAGDDAIHQARFAIQGLREIYGLPLLDHAVAPPPASKWVEDPLGLANETRSIPVPSARRSRP